MASTIKSLGNDLFKTGKYKAADVKYKKSLRYLDAIHPSPADLEELTIDQKKMIYSIKLSCLLNSAMVKLYKIDYFRRVSRHKII